MKNKPKVKPRFKWIELEYEEQGRPINRQYLADQLGVSRQMISNYFTGKSYPPADKLFLLARLLGKKVDDLYTIEEKK